MQQILGIGVLVMIVADAVVGVRLLLLAARNRRLPEFCFGSSFLALGVFGYPLSIVARKAALAGVPAPALLSTAFCFQDLASLMMMPGYLADVSRGFSLSPCVGVDRRRGIRREPPGRLFRRGSVAASGRRTVVRAGILGARQCICLECAGSRALLRSDAPPAGRRTGRPGGGGPVPAVGDLGGLLRLLHGKAVSACA